MRIDLRTPRPRCEVRRVVRRARGFSRCTRRRIQIAEVKSIDRSQRTPRETDPIGFFVCGNTFGAM